MNKCKRYRIIKRKNKIIKLTNTEYNFPTILIHHSHTRTHTVCNKTINRLQEGQTRTCTPKAVSTCFFFGETQIPRTRLSTDWLDLGRESQTRICRYSEGFVVNWRSVMWGAHHWQTSVNASWDLIYNQFKVVSKIIGQKN